MKKKVLPLLLAVLLVFTALAGCNENTPASSGGSTASSSGDTQ